MSSLEAGMQTRAAVSAIVVSVAALSLGDAVIKGNGVSLPLWQMFILRSLIVIPVLWWLVRKRASQFSSNIVWAIIRSVLLALMWLSYYSALNIMPLPLAAAAYYTGPLLIVALSAMVAQKWPSGLTIVAVVIGFGGVLSIIRPDASGIAPTTLLPILSAFLYACAMILTSAKCQNDDPVVLALILHTTFVFCGAILGLFSGRAGSFLLGPWQPLDLQIVATIIALAILILIGSIGAAFAYQKGPPTTVAAFDYSYLLFSLLWGILFFAEVPGAAGLFGMGLILFAGFLALLSKERANT